MSASPSDAKVVVVAGETAFREDAIRLAERLGLPIADTVEPPRGGYSLVFARHRLELHSSTVGRSRPLFVDFVGGTTGYRRVSGQSRKQPLARAVGVKGSPPTVVDATAGIGRDAFLLAGLGCNVTMLERSPVLHALLSDALKRAAGASTAIDDILSRMTLHRADARRFLQELPARQRPEVVYLDPMYAPSKRSALSGREVRLCRELVGGDLDAAELFDVARQVATGRVVVKRHRSADPLAPNPTVRFEGRTVRYDAYLRKPISSGSGI
jgi:16S rRNA (guanine1516-N2)-methyltransferase